MSASWATLSPRPDQRRWTVRRLAALASVVTAAVYLGIGFGILDIVDEVPTKAAGGGLFEFGLGAGATFLVGAALLLLLDRRPIWLLGALLQVVVIVMYFLVSSVRTPPFPSWGLLIKGLQAAILVALVYLVIRPASQTRVR